MVWVGLLILCGCSSQPSSQPSTRPPAPSATEAATPAPGVAASRGPGLTKVPGHHARISPSGQIVVAADDGLVFYEASAGALVEVRRWSPGQVGKVVGEFAFSHAGDQVAVISSHTTITLFDLETAKVLRVLETPPRDNHLYRLGGHMVAWRGKLVAASSGFGKVFLWSLERPLRPERPDEGVAAIDASTGVSNSRQTRNPIAFTPDSKRLAFGVNTERAGADHPCLGWLDFPLRDLTGAARLAAPVSCTIHDIATWPGGTVWVGAFAGRERAFALGPAQGADALRTIALRDAADQPVLLEVTAVAITSDGKQLVLGDELGWIWLADAATGKFVRELRPRQTTKGSRIAMLDLGQTFVVAVYRESSEDPVVSLFPL